VKTQSGVFKCVDGNFYEVTGVPPNEEVAQDWGQFFAAANPRDTRLEAAIRRLGSDLPF
jgi:hypothetical protein